jgi:protease-4
MKVSSLISEIIRGQWLLDPQTVESYYPFIESILKGQKSQFESSYPSENKAFSVLDKNGNALRSNDENEPVQVPPGSIARVNMIGEILAYSDWCTAGADEIVQQLYNAQALKNVTGTVFMIDSPGGSVKAIEAFREFAKYKEKPVVALCADALSLGYWAALEVADEIYAYGSVSPRFGSVGVVASFMNNKEAMKKAGYEFVQIYPKESEHKNQAFNLALEGKYDMIKTEHLSPLAIQFQNAVKSAMPNINKEALGVLTGKTFYAQEALDLGMIHGITDMRGAMMRVKELALIKSINEF